MFGLFNELGPLQLDGQDLQLDGEDKDQLDGLQRRQVRRHGRQGARRPATH